MSSPSPRVVRGGSLLDVAEKLRRSCASLKASLEALAGAADEGVERAAAAHLQEAAPLQETISQQAGALRRRRDEAEQLSGGQQDALRREVDHSRRTLQDAGDAYGRFARRVRQIREEVEARLRRVRRGGHALGRYGDAARLAQSHARRP